MAEPFPHVSNHYTFMKTLTKTVLVAGAQGVIGRAAAEHFSKEADTTVYAVSRRPVVGLKNVHPISADLLDPADTRTKLEALKDVTQGVFGAYVENDTPASVAPLMSPSCA